MISATQKTPINIVWFKRDLRLQDHEPLKRACESALPTVLFFTFEPSLIAQPDSDTRHWRFVYESLCHLEDTLGQLGKNIEILFGNADEVLACIAQHYAVQFIFSHQEHGTLATYERDKRVTALCKQHAIQWVESQSFGVVRGSKNRDNWLKQWHTFMEKPWDNPPLEPLETLTLTEPIKQLFSREKIPQAFKERNLNFQPGGTHKAEKYLMSFLSERISSYQRGISKPALSRKTCSRLSPYLAYGCVSLRQVYQLTLLAKSKQKGNGRNFNAFLSRLHWHCHFIQKFEVETRMQLENFNLAFNKLDRKFNAEWHEKFVTGQTGYPMVDANVRCLIETGYINFRMRAMLVAFYTFNLWMPWQPLSIFLAQNFLDYEPGIHYPQIQMQAGTTGIHLLRMYNVITQAEKHDTQNEFILKWIPELAVLPSNLVKTPWAITQMEQVLYGFTPGITYPLPIVDIEKTTKNTRDKFAEILKSKACMLENQRILKKHVRLKQREQEM
ncbi:MAG: FAD-binding domain-containing protein, partial [Luteibaculaceae bacterium]